MNEISAIKKIDFKNIKIGESIKIHVDRLASFKSTVSMHNKGKDIRFSFTYGYAIDNYVIATRKKYVSRLVK